MHNNDEFVTGGQKIYTMLNVTVLIASQSTSVINVQHLLLLWPNWW